MSAVTHPLELDDLERLCGLPPRLALRSAGSFLVSLVKDPSFMVAYVLPHLEEAGESKDWYVAHRHDGQNGLYSLQVFVWPAHTRTNIHDHASWGAYCCAVGSLLEERYRRLDDGSRLNHARLEKIWQMSWSREDGVSTVLPFEKGIHRVGNSGDSPAISVHLYGPRLGEVEGRDYDPRQNYVCDRLED